VCPPPRDGHAKAPVIGMLWGPTRSSGCATNSPCAGRACELACFIRPRCRSGHLGPPFLALSAQGVAAAAVAAVS
jgi:hypothetical protein